MAKHGMLLLLLCALLFPITVQADEIYLVRVRTESGVRELDLEKYLIGVVLAEMPSDFEPEALKAQAVAARTYVWRAILCGSKHPDCDLCTNPSCCQGYVNQAPDEDWLRVCDAVTQTAGIILTFENNPIEASFFSCSGGFTEDAAAVWGTDYPYLTAKESPGEEIAFCYQDTRTFPKEELEALLEIPLTGAPSEWFGSWEFTNGRGVASVRICGYYFTGTALRKKLGLRSTVFSVETSETTICFFTKGFGHRVGMSQYGAEVQALSGKSCEQILTYYYSGAELTNISEFLSRNSS